MMSRGPVIAFFAALALLSFVQSPAARQSPRGLVGTWVLDQAQRTDGGAPIAVPAPRGLIIFDAAGHVLEIVTRAGRQLYAANQPTPEEALVTFMNYGGFWGTYKANDKAGSITYQPAAGISPNVANTELVRSYQLAGDRLTLESRAEPGAQGHMRTTWRRVPHIENLTPAYRQVLGFWQWVGEGSYLTSTGAAVSQGKRDQSIIVYAPSGYLGVHFIPAARKRIMGAMPTADEARASLTGYVSYIAVLGLYPPAHIIHHQLAALVPNNTGAPLERDFELRGNEIHLRFPPSVIQGQERETRVTLKRLSGAAEMMGQSSTP